MKIQPLQQNSWFQPFISLAGGKSIFLQGIARKLNHGKENERIRKRVTNMVVKIRIPLKIVGV